MSFFKSEKEIEAHVAQMTTGQREHFKMIISQLIECYTVPGKHGMVLVGDGSPAMLLLAINATEMEAAALMQCAEKHLHEVVTDDAPPKGMFN